MMTCLPGIRKLGYHLPASEIPSDLRDKPVLGTVRNPLAYYVSWYHFQNGLPAARRNALFQICSEGGTLGFEATIKRLVLLEREPEIVDALIDAFPSHFVGSGLNLTKSCIAEISNCGRGFYSFLYFRMYGSAPDATILRAEELRPSLSMYLAPIYPGGTCWQHFIEQAPDMNKSEHGDVQSYYSNDLRQLVFELDRPVFETHKYKNR